MLISDQAQSVIELEHLIQQRMKLIYWAFGETHPNDSERENANAQFMSLCIECFGFVESNFNSFIENHQFAPDTTDTQKFGRFLATGMLQCKTQVLNFSVIISALLESLNNREKQLLESLNNQEKQSSLETSDVLRRVVESNEPFENCLKQQLDLLKKDVQNTQYSSLPNQLKDLKEQVLAQQRTRLLHPEEGVFSLTENYRLLLGSINDYASFSCGSLLHVRKNGPNDIAINFLEHHSRACEMLVQARNLLAPLFEQERERMAEFGADEFSKPPINRLH